MTDLLSADARRSASGGGRLAGRSLTLTAVVGALGAAGAALVLCAGVALAGWFAADAGRFGDTRDAVRIGADAWLMAHGAGLRLESATVTLAPLGLTLICVYVAFRFGRWAGRTSRVGADAEEVREALRGLVVQASVYAVAALLVAAATSLPDAEVGVFRAFVGAFVLSFVAGGGGILAGTGQARVLMASAPERARSVLLGAAATVLVMLAVAAFWVAAALVADFGTAATVLSRLHTDGPGGLMYVVVSALFVPNAVLMGTAYLLGPGFAVGTSTAVSPTAVVLGPVPAFPLLAALPGDGATPAWTAAVTGLPVVVGLVGALLAARLVPVTRLDAGALRGLLGGVLAGLVLTVLVLLAGGAAGPGRMADIGADGWSVLARAVVSFGGGGLLGGLLGAWRARRAGAGAS